MEMIQLEELGGSSEWAAGSNVIFHHEGQQQPLVQDILFEGIEGVMGGQQFFILDSNNRILPFDPDSLPIFEDDEVEIPSHTLDHMYAKKPRDPDTETTKPPRRRSKKKEPLVNHLFFQEVVESPKINIIRQRMPVSGNVKCQKFSGPPRPKILSKKVRSNPQDSKRSVSFSPRLLQPDDIEEVQNRFGPSEPSSLNDLVDPMSFSKALRDEEEEMAAAQDLFLDFPIEESEESGNLDVDFAELPSIQLADLPSVPCPVGLSLSASTSSASSSPQRRISVTSNNYGQTSKIFPSRLLISTPKTTRARVQEPMPMMSSTTDVKVKKEPLPVLTPTRRSTRPVKTPARLDDAAVEISKGRKRRS